MAKRWMMVGIDSFKRQSEPFYHVIYIYLRSMFGLN